MEERRLKNGFYELSLNISSIYCSVRIFLVCQKKSYTRQSYNWMHINCRMMTENL